MNGIVAKMKSDFGFFDSEFFEKFLTGIRERILCLKVKKKSSNFLSPNFKLEDSFESMESLIVKSNIVNDKDSIKSQLDKYSKHRIGVEKSNIINLFSYFNSKKSELLKNCGTYLQFSKYQNLSSNDIINTLSKANFCKINKFCPMCSWRNASQVAMECLYKLNFLADQARQAHKSKPRVLFLTLTVKNPVLTDLRDTVNHINRSFKRLMELDRTQCIKGYFRAFEFLGDHTPQGQAHPHLHVLLVVDSEYFDTNKDLYINQEEWVKLWKQSLRVDYDPLVDIKVVKPKKKNGKTMSSLLCASLECAKYCVTPADLISISQSDFKILYEQTKSLRQYVFGGVLRDIEYVKEELSQDEWELISTEIYQWLKGKYVFKPN